MMVIFSSYLKHMLAVSCRSMQTTDLCLSCGGSLNVTPCSVHLGCLIQLCSEAGRTTELTELIRLTVHMFYADQFIVHKLYVY